MVDKIVHIASSIRFWFITFAAILAVLAGADIIWTAQGWAIVVAAVGTIDKLGESIGGARS